MEKLTQASEHPRFSSRRKRVLVVDDDAGFASECGRRLVQAGHEVRVEVAGVGALTAAEEFRPDMILLDIAMPGMSGFAVASRLRKLGLSRDIVMIAFTEAVEPLLYRRLADFRFDACLLKRATDAELLDMVSLERAHCRGPSAHDERLQVNAATASIAGGQAR